MVEGIVLIAPFLLILALAGYGAAFITLLAKHRTSPADFFEVAFVGLFLLTAAALIANFFTGTGIAPGFFVLTLGLGLFIFFGRRFRPPATILLVTFLSSLIFLLRSGMQLPYDAGLYYLSVMNWVAHQPIPFGLANLEGRLGFDSAWLLFESLLRDGPFLGWTHIVIVEIALRSLALGWIAQRFLSAKTGGRHAESNFFLTGFVVLSAYLLVRFSSPTTTDLPANLLAFCAWMAFGELMLQEPPKRSGRQLSFLVMLAVLAITIKIAMLPILVLPAWLLARMSGSELKRFVRAEAWLLCTTALYAGLWLVRNFILSGCLVFPVALTCFPVHWGAGTTAGPMTAVVRGWARYPGTGAPNSWLFDTAWLPSWFAGFVKSPEALLVLLAIIAALTFHLLPDLRKGSRRSSVGLLTMPTLVCAALGLLLWFSTAPDPRFSWCFFAILAVVIILPVVCDRDFVPRIADNSLLTARTALSIAIVLGAGTLTIQLSRGAGRIDAPSPSFRIASTSTALQIYQTMPGQDQCWELFPCTPYGLGGVTVESWHGHLVFRSNASASR